VNYQPKAVQVGVAVDLYPEAACFESWTRQQMPWSWPNQIKYWVVESKCTEGCVRL